MDFEILCSLQYFCAHWAVPVAPAMASIRAITGDRKLPCQKEQTVLELRTGAKYFLSGICVCCRNGYWSVTNGRVFIIYSESEMSLFEVLFGGSDRNPAVETVSILHHAEQLLFINKHKHPLWKRENKLCGSPQTSNSCWNGFNWCWRTVKWPINQNSAFITHGIFLREPEEDFHSNIKHDTHQRSWLLTSRA